MTWNLADNLNHCEKKWRDGATTSCIPQDDSQCPAGGPGSPGNPIDPDGPVSPRFPGGPEGP
ncbi:unnamed protein product [Brugia timori]|uniref:Bm13040 n=2 Tax=Brugia TaxID=6278 RepID=A0A1I9G7N5_BRUMA|nr:Bm13040 [Brugia malayi]VDO40755.1 unnamed protein product [Brugia timori]